MSNPTLPPPKPVYGCANEACAEEVSWPATDIVWFSGTDEICAGWYCDNCLDEYTDRYDDRGVSLADYLAGGCAS